ncbi:zinc finger protein 830 [Anopheles merus]|uniref:zinc finger protein 830 n=1 Tax=Anopheles merus TaxID=30066 RepID=UPI001BE455A4|nr:zinc finger protein 830 [Anopheles merus]
MSAAFKLSKKKYSQQDLRRIMSETKAAKQQQSDSELKRVESPLAKYNDAGQLMCVLCRSIVRSAAVWKVHIHSKQHKENNELAKKLKDSSAVDSVEPRNAPNVNLKRTGGPDTGVDTVPVKKIKGILKNSSQTGATQDALPHDFFDDAANSANVPSSIRKDLVNIKLPEKHRGQVAEPMELDHTEKDVGGSLIMVDEEKLPEGFFDDPKMDAKARNQEYKDPNDEEWEKFQKEIKEATNISMAIISEEQEESTAERQIAEIDEQIRNWSRVLDLEKKKEQVKTLKGVKGSEMFLSSAKRTGQPAQTANGNDREEDDDDADEEFDEFLDWRAKKSYK